MPYGSFRLRDYPSRQNVRGGHPFELGCGQLVDPQRPTERPSLDRPGQTGRLRMQIGAAAGLTLAHVDQQLGLRPHQPQ